MHQFWGTRCSTNDADKVGMVTFVGSVLERTLVAVQPWPMRLLSVQRQFVSQDKCRTLGKQHLELYLASPDLILVIASNLECSIGEVLTWLTRLLSIITITPLWGYSSMACEKFIEKGDIHRLIRICPTIQHKIIELPRPTLYRT